MSWWPSGASLILEAVKRLLVSKPAPLPNNINVELNFTFNNTETINAMPDENALEELSKEDAEAMKLLLLDLLHMNRRAEAQGSSLVDIIVQAARDQKGIDIRPSHDRGLVSRRANEVDGY